MKCSTPYCRNQRAKHRTICGSCKTKKYRLNNPMKYAFQSLKDNAKRRGKEFNITFEDFKQFCNESDYLRGKGKSSTSYSIDRIDNTKGYTLDNIQILTLSENSKKQSKTLNAYYNAETGKVEAYVTKSNFENEDDWDKIFEDAKLKSEQTKNHKEDCDCDCCIPF
jgi:hypothetical protein